MIQARNPTLRQRVTVLAVVVATALALLAGVAAVFGANNREHLDTLLNRTGPLRADAESLMAALVDQETGVRGFAVSGDRRDLVPYEAGRERERDLLASMEQRIGRDDGIRQRLRAVEDRADDWRRTVAEPVIQAGSTRGTGAAQDLLTPAGRERFEEIRTAVDALQAEIRERRESTARDAQRTGDTLVLLLITAAVVVVLAGIALLVALSRLVIAPVTDLAGQVRHVAGGDYQRDIDIVGPPELMRLASDVDAMRRRIAADLTEMREARARIEWVNSQLQQQAEELTRSNRDLEQFAYVASHDLQEPLRKVASFCQLLQRRYAGQLDERADQYIAFAVDGAQRMQRLINDLLAFSRIGRLTSGLTEVDLNRVMGDVAQQTEAARQYAGGELTWSELPMVLGEEPLLTNLLANLVSNSLKFRRPDVPPRVHVSARRVGQEWEITCRDNGIGIEPEFADKIFVIFQRLHAKDAYPGTGIGLAIVKKIAEYHGGRVWVDPEVTEGSAIRFTLPVLPEQLGAGDLPEPGDEETGRESSAAAADQAEETVGVKEMRA